MEWLTSIRTAIDYMEEHLKDNISAQDVADQVYLSPFFLQRGFSLMTGYGIGEYIRNRRLYQAALDLKETDDKVIDIAFRYGYETPESFTKAFSRFHGVTPSQARDSAIVRTFLPLTVKLQIQGGDQMNCKITTMFPFKVIGFQKVFDNETAYQEIPKFWDEICEKYAANVYAGNAGTRSVRSMRLMFMPGMLRQILMRRLSWRTASESTVFVSTISERESSVILWPVSMSEAKFPKEWWSMNFREETGRYLTASARSRRHCRV